MKFIELFDSRDKKKRISHIRNLIALTAADGSIDRVELELVFRIGINGGLTREEVNRIASRPESVKFYPPESSRERVEQLYDMIMVTMIDGEVHENEILFCKAIALKLGFQHQVIDKIFEDVVSSIASGIIADVAIDNLVSGM